MSFNSSLIVLNYNTGEFINTCLASIEKAVRKSKYQHEIILVDNASHDNSVSLVKQKFPNVKIVQNATNRYIFGLKDGVAVAENKYVLFLNNDIVVDEDFLDPLLENFKDPELFAVTARILELLTGKDQGARTRCIYKEGILFYESLPHVNKKTDCFFAVGGQSAFDKEKLLAIGSLDELFWPLYHEDIELSYRAWKCGYKILYEPQSVINHYGGMSSVKVFTKTQLRSFVAQNEFLMVWKNFTDKKMIRDICLYHPLRFLKAVLTFDFGRVRGYSRAIVRIGPMLIARKKVKRLFKRADQEVLAIICQIK